MREMASLKQHFSKTPASTFSTLVVLVAASSAFALTALGALSSKGRTSKSGPWGMHAGVGARPRSGFLFTEGEKNAYAT